MHWQTTIIMTTVNDDQWQFYVWTRDVGPRTLASPPKFLILD